MRGKTFVHTRTYPGTSFQMYLIPIPNYYEVIRPSYTDTEQ